MPRKRDIEKVYSRKQFAAKLRRLARAVERGQRFVLHVAGVRVSIPAAASISVEHERSGRREEVEFQLRWNRTT